MVVKAYKEKIMTKFRSNKGSTCRQTHATVTNFRVAHKISGNKVFTSHTEAESFLPVDQNLYIQLPKLSHSPITPEKHDLTVLKTAFRRFLVQPVLL